MEKAALENALSRARKGEEEELMRARQKYAQTLDNIRQQAGEWADLVPEFRV